MNARWVDSMTFLSCRYSTLLLKVNKRYIPISFQLVFPVFSCVVYFVYTNHCEVTEEVVGELLTTAVMFLLPGLTKLAGKLLAKLVTADSVMDILHTARY